MYIYIYNMHIYTHTYMCMYICMYIEDICIYIYMCTYVYTYIHISYNHYHGFPKQGFPRQGFSGMIREMFGMIRKQVEAARVPLNPSTIACPVLSCAYIWSCSFVSRVGMCALILSRSCICARVGNRPYGPKHVIYYTLYIVSHIYMYIYIYIYIYIWIHKYIFF